MNTPNPKARRIDEATERTFVAAVEAYMDTGECAVFCDVCRTPIEFARLAETAWEHRCSCGKYKGTLRGL
jgi:hypothetical protein